ncbi:14091_t:CDS:2 [Entrophospora sp. SA101]|nr:14091_t:CDS:2 [Entrophospora sp. SA101]
MATFIRKFRYQTVLSSLLQQNRLPVFFNTADNNNKTSMNTNNADGTSFPSLPEFSSDNNKNARSKSEELTIKDLSNDITDGGQD